MKKRIFIRCNTIICPTLLLQASWGFKPSENVLPAIEAETQASYADIPRKGPSPMLDLGADKCIPCKMIGPIIEKLAKDYKGKADIVFIDVWKNPKQAERLR